MITRAALRKAALRKAAQAFLEAAVIGGKTPAAAMVEMDLVMHDAKQHLFMLEDIPGVRYWYHDESESCFAAWPYDEKFQDCGDLKEVSRSVFLEHMENDF